ncbi:hypothetical protein Btru_037426 [Bulinus truncatus]|nr:hypothetical protein Btru_037426 [Bulinus truncatus]
MADRLPCTLTQSLESCESWMTECHTVITGSTLDKADQIKRLTTEKERCLLKKFHDSIHTFGILLGCNLKMAPAATNTHPPRPPRQPTPSTPLFLAVSITVTWFSADSPRAPTLANDAVMKSPATINSGSNLS